MNVEAANSPTLEAESPALQQRAPEGETSKRAAATITGPRRGSTWLERWLLKKVVAACGAPPVRVELWDGFTMGPAQADTVGVIRLRDPGALRGLFPDPVVGFGEGYSQGTIEVAGDLVETLCAVERAMYQVKGRGLLRWLLTRRRRERSNTKARSSANVHHHYDIGNDFYRLWLDERLVYTCAYYAEPAMNLEAAQLAKMDHVCRKLRLRPGEVVVEAGCGWGSLALHMARHYGARVRAYNLSREQIRYAREQAQRQELADRVEFIHDDYRSATGPCDAFVSVGMLEHVGRANYEALGAVIDRCLTPAGRGLIHSIGRNAPRPLDSWTTKRIFPGAYPPALSEMTRIFEPYRFSILDVENLRLHYARTLEQWLERFEMARHEVARMFDETFVRTWRLYLSGSIAAFRVGGLQLFQVVFAREANNDVPWTRAFLYEST